MKSIKLRSLCVLSLILSVISIQLYNLKLAAAAPKIQEPEMVYIKGSCYMMGDVFDAGSDRERPVHEVCLDDYYLGKYEVTQELWKTVMGYNPAKFTGDRLPIENISWDEIQQFISKLNKTTGKNYRLPTEAEWEYAARSGGKMEMWSGTSDENELNKHAWFDTNSGKKTHAVGTTKPNALGLFDMTGNVWEWCQDRYEDNFYNHSPKKNPLGQAGIFAVYRGGCWYDFQFDIRNTARRITTPDPDFKGHCIGFRLARSKS